MAKDAEGCWCEAIAPYCALLRSEGVLFDENGRADKDQRWRLDDYTALAGTSDDGASLPGGTTPADRGRPAEGGSPSTS